MRWVFSSAVVGAFFTIPELLIAGNALALREPTRIPAEPLALAVQTLAKERGFQVVYVAGDVGHQRTRGAFGNLSAEEALAQLLRGTGLTFRKVSENGVVIAPTGNQPDPASPKQQNAGAGQAAKGKAQRSFPSRFRVAQVDKGPPQRATLGETSDSGSSALRTIIVTAQKFQQPIYQVPIALQAIQSSTIKNFQVLNLSELTQFAPGVSFDETGTTTRIFVDGVSSGFGTGALTALYINDADVTASPNPFAMNTPDIRTYDMQRVEVLHGPQGTLYGEGAEGGAVHFVTNEPNLTEFAGGLTAGLLFTDGGQPGEQVLPVFNIPIVSGELGLRVAGEYSHVGGYINQSQASLKGINSQNLSDTRIELAWQPMHELTIDLMQIFHRNLFGLSNSFGVDGNGNFTFPFNLAFRPTGQDQYNVSNGKVSYQLPGELGTISNSTTYYSDELQERSTVSGDYGFPLVLVGAPSFGRFSGLTDELRESGSSQSWNWIAGGIFRHSHTEENSPFCIFPDGASVSAPDDTFDSLASNPSGFCSAINGEKILDRAYSIYADLHYTLPVLERRVSIGFGGRYYHDDQGFLGSYPAPSVKQEALFTSTDPRYNLSVKLTRRINAYVSASKGFRSGGFNLQNPVFGEQTKPPFKPETLWRYEGGIRLHGFRDFTASLSLYVDNWREMQTAAIEPGLNGALGEVFVNSGQVNIKGLDAFVTWASPFEWFPVRNWTVTLNGSYADGKVISTGGVVSSLTVGERPEDIPAYTYNVSLERDFHGLGKAWHFAANYYQQNRSFYTDHTFSAPGFSAPGFTYASSDRLYLLSLAAGVQWNEQVGISLKVANLLNDRGYPYVFAIPALSGGAPREQPRTVGLYVSVKF